MKLEFKCNICNTYWKNNGALSIHVSRTHKVSPEEYYNKFYKKPQEGLCKSCGSSTTFLSINRGYLIFCSLKCAENDENIKNKRLKTNNEKYGGIGFASKILKDKAQKTATKNGNIIDSPNNIVKMQNTMNKIYGENCPSKIDFFKNKIKNTKEQNGKGINPKFKYNDLYFDSSWELAYYIWLKDHDIDFEYHKKHFYFNYEFEGKTHRYYPDFIVGDRIIDIKNKHLYYKLMIENTIDNAKYNCIKNNNVELLLEKDIMPYLNYIDTTYGEDYLMRFICQKE